VSNLENKYSLIANIKHKRYGGVLPTVTANDNVLFEIELYDDVTKYDLSEVTSVTLVTMKKNKTSVIRNGTMVNGLLRFKIGGSETTESGRVEGTIQLYDVDNNRISSAPIAFEVVRDPSLQGVLPTDDKTLVIANESLFLETIEKGNNLQEQLDTLVVSGDSSPAADQARVDAKGVTKSSLKTRLDDDYNELSSSVAQIATNITTHFLVPETDWTPAIRRAIAATPKGGTLLIPPNSDGYYVKNLTEKYLFKLDKPIRIVGYGITSMLLLDENIPADTDIFLLSPATSSDIEGYEISGITMLGRNGSTPARHAIHLDTTLSHQKIARSKFTGNFIYPTGGNSIYLTNPTNSDGFFSSQIQKNLIYSGINLQRGGDSLTITENTIAGYNGVDISLVSGSNTLVFAFNNLTSRKGIIIRGGHNIKILYNNLEVGYADSVYTNGALLDIDGSDITQDWGLLAVEILGNNLTYRTTAPDGVNGIRINKARGATIEGNHITNKNSTMIVITSLAQETRLGYNLYSSADPSGIITDAGRNTIRENVHKLNSFTGNREVYEIDSSVARWKVNTMWNLLDNQNIESITGGNAPALSYIWQAANAFNSKYKFQTQLRNTDGTLAAAKPYAYLGDGYQYFVNGGFALVDSAGFRWKVNVNTDGTLATTKMT
jgi:hypothetical protein